MLLPIALFVVSLVTLLAAQVHKSWPKPRQGSPLTTVAVAFLALAGVAIIATVANHFFVKSLLEDLADAFAVRRELAWAATLFASGALSYFLAKSVSLRTSDRRLGFLGVSTLVAAYFLALYAGTRGDHFALDGTPQTCVAWDESGVRRYPRQQIDRQTGHPCILVTPENRDELVPMLGRLDATPKPKAEPPFFGSRSYVNGPVPLAWFSRNEAGTIELWDAPGHHPTTSETLRPVTAEIIRAWTQQRQLTASSGATGTPGSDAGTAGATPRPDEPTAAARVISPGQALRDRYLSVSAVAGPRDGQRPRWALLAWSADGRLDPQVSNQIALVARSAGLAPPSTVFTESFVQDGIADRVLRGDASMLVQMELSGVVDFIVLARAEERRLPDRGAETLKAVDYELRAQVLRAGDLSTSSPVRIAQGAAGYDYELAAQRARDAALGEPMAVLGAMLKDFVR